MQADKQRKKACRETRTRCRYTWYVTFFRRYAGHTHPTHALFVSTRFQLKLVYGCGHSVQEDQPNETAASIINFAIR